MSIYIAALVVCTLLVIAVFQLLRTRRIREKYAAIWIVLTIAVVLTGAFPELAFWVSDLVGVQTPANLVFALAIVVLLAVCIQLSAEISNLEEETRSLAEEIALLRLDVRQVKEGRPARPTTGEPTTRAPDVTAAAAPVDAAPAEPEA